MDKHCLAEKGWQGRRFERQHMVHFVCVGIDNGMRNKGAGIYTIAPLFPPSIPILTYNNKCFHMYVRGTCKYRILYTILLIAHAVTILCVHVCSCPCKLFSDQSVHNSTCYHNIQWILDQQS